MPISSLSGEQVAAAMRPAPIGKELVSLAALMALAAVDRAWLWAWSRGWAGCGQ